MSRIANNPVYIPKGVEITLSGQEVTVKGSHFLQEDAPGQIGQAVANWMAQTQ